MLTGTMSSMPWSPPRPRPRPPHGLPFSFFPLLSIPRPLPGPLPLPLPLCPTENDILGESDWTRCVLSDAHHSTSVICWLHILLTVTILIFMVNKWLVFWDVHTLLLFHRPHVSSLHMLLCMASLPLTLGSWILWLRVLRHVIFVILLLLFVVISVITVVAVFLKIAALVRWWLHMASLWIPSMLLGKDPRSKLSQSKC